mmetsp:Transcript_10686/g.18968  ORF Transcript_10686/g.18968 Transcript_10686/m.18968 type:complete len:293 (-) Transcript_10686:73-951(-)
MSTSNCAACGKGGEGLKKCAACNAIRYCSVACQKTHWSVHRQACKKRATELKEEALFKDPPPREECAVCFLPLPIDNTLTSYQSCCGKILCFGCTFASGLNNPKLLIPPCPFCRKPTAKTVQEINERVDKRMALNDVDALTNRAGDYDLGVQGFPIDHVKAFELYSRAADLGSMSAHYSLGNFYRHGKGVPANTKKAMHHNTIAAIGGNTQARNNLGASEAVAGNFPRAMKHFVIAASAGFENAMKGLRMGYSEGYISKEDFDNALRAYGEAVDEMNSDQRDVAAKAATIGR